MANSLAYFLPTIFQLSGSGSSDNDGHILLPDSPILQACCATRVNALESAISSVCLSMIFSLALCVILRLRSTHCENTQIRNMEEGGLVRLCPRYDFRHSHLPIDYKSSREVRNHRNSIQIHVAYNSMWQFLRDICHSVLLQHLSSGPWIIGIAMATYAKTVFIPGHINPLTDLTTPATSITNRFKFLYNALLPAPLLQIISIKNRWKNIWRYKELSNNSELRDAPARWN